MITLRRRLNIRQLSIRWRITLGTLVVATVLTVAAVVGFRAQVERILATSTTTVLQHDAAPYAAQVASNPNTVAQPGRAQLVAVLDPHGNVITTSLPRSLESQLATLVAITGSTRTVFAEGEEYRVYNQPVISIAGVWHVITARNEDSSTLSLDHITQALIVGAGIIVLSFGIASYLLTAAALRPVTRMRRQAEALAAQGSTEPLPVGPAMDELDGLAETLNEFITEVRQSVDRERQLVSDASHELRTPIAILMTQLELAHLSSGDAVALEFEISQAERSVGRLSALATGLLQLSQLEQPTGQTPRSSWNEIATELAATVDSARMLAVANRVTIDFDVDDAPTDDLYRISTSNFGRLVNNLATNAVTAIGSDGWVRIALRHSPVGLALTVVDSGPGIPESFLPIAFDRFSRPDESRAKNSGGSGLGLAIVHAIVVAAGGTVSLANANGLSVTVTLPV